jgi:hypothetical protein
MYKVGIYQIAYDSQGLHCIDPEFIRYFNRRKDQYFENSVIVEIYRSGRYRMFDYCGVLSWRFRQKTGMTGRELISLINQQPWYDAFAIIPGAMKKDEHPYSRITCQPVMDLARAIDDMNILPVKLYGFRGLKIWNNYWVAKREVFKSYVENFLIPVIECLDYPNEKIKYICEKKIPHREREMNISYNAVPFFFEGLFYVYCEYRKLKVLLK